MSDDNERTDNTINNDKTRIALIDYDGTLSATQTGAVLAAYLVFNGYVDMRNLPALFKWGMEYLISKDRDLASSREILFQRFAGRKVSEVDTVFDHFYNRHCRPFIREGAIKEIRSLQKEGIKVIIASGAFAQIIRRVALHVGADGWIGVHMERAVDDNGDEIYTGKVREGEHICEGKGKCEAVENYADKAFGKNNWHIVVAYGDHYTDRHMLEMADRPVCANGELLQLYAMKHGWEYVRWRKKSWNSNQHASTNADHKPLRELSTLFIPPYIQ